MLKKFVSLILTAMIITSAVSVTTALAVPLSTKIIDFELENDDVASIINSSTSFTMSRCAPSSAEPTFPASAENYVFKISCNESGKGNINIENMDMTTGIIEYKMDFYFNVNTSAAGIGISMQTDTEKYGNRNVLWRTIANSNRIQSGSNSGNSYTSTNTFTSSTWYTVKTVINIDEKSYSIYYKESDDVDVEENYTPVNFENKTESNIQYIDYSQFTDSETKITALNIYFHVNTTLPQYVDNISIKTYDNPVTAINTASDATKIETVLNDLSDMGLFSYGNAKYMVSDYNTALLDIKDKNITSVADIQTAYDVAMAENKASYITNAVTLDDLQGGQYVNSDGDIFYQINNNSYADFESPINGIVDIKFDTFVKAATTDDIKYNIGFNESKEYNKNGRLMSLIADKRMSASNSAWIENKMPYDVWTNIRLILNNTDSDAETLHGYLDGKVIMFPRSYADESSPKNESVYVYDGVQTSQNKNNNGNFVTNPRYLVFNPGENPTATLNYINNLTAVVYKPFHTAVNDALNALELREIFEKYADLGEITLSENADYTKLFDAIKDKEYTNSADIQKDYDLLLKEGDIYAELDGNNLTISFINQVDLSSGTLILASYKGNELTECKIISFDKKLYNPTNIVTADLSDFSGKENTLSVFAWKGIDADIAPLAKKADVIKK